MTARALKVLLASALLGLLLGCAGAGVKTGQYVDDATITAKVKTALAADKEVSVLDVHVDTTGGRVQLSGAVKRVEEKRRAEEIAHSVAGVKSVSNTLTVSGN